MKWYGNLNMQRKNKLQRIVNMASKIIGKQQKHLSVMYDEQILNKTRKIINDPSHPLQCEFELLPSVRRFRVPNAIKNSFVPTGIRVINNTGFYS